MTGEEVAVRALTPPQEHAAVLDAHGHSREEISKVVGCSIPTVSNWRKLPEYNARVAELSLREADAIDSALQKVKKSIVEAADDAVKALREALEATDDQGNPIYKIRMGAAEVLLAQLSRAGLPPEGEGDGSGGGGAKTAVIVVQSPPQGG